MEYATENKKHLIDKSEMLREAFILLINSLKDYRQIYGKSALDQTLLFSQDAE